VILKREKQNAASRHLSKFRNSRKTVSPRYRSTEILVLVFVSSNSLWILSFKVLVNTWKLLPQPGQAAAFAWSDTPWEDKGVIWNF